MAKAPSIPQISDAEWEVMKVVWDDGPLTAGDVVRRLAEVSAGHPAKDWRPRTIKTLLGRLVRKGAVSGQEVDGATATGAAGASGGKRFLYRACVARDQVIRQESRSFLARVFNGSVAPALLHFIQDASLTADEINQLRETLRREAEAKSGKRKTDKD